MGRPRLRRANRQRVVFRAAPSDALIADDHTARTIWAYVEGLDLDTLYHAIGPVHGGSGRAATDPGILLALRLYATVEGLGSARALDRLGRGHLAYRWIAGDVPMNDHTLADFRTDHLALLDGLLTRSIATLMAEDLVDLNRVAQGGMRVRASAGVASFRRRPTLDEALTRAEAHVEALRAEVEGDPAAADRRRRGAPQGAARERVERVQAASGRLPGLEAKKKAEAEEKHKARCATTDPEATVAKMAGGGPRPAYDVQLATAVGGQVIVGVAVIASGSDAGQMAPTVEQVRGRCGVTPAEMPVDGGFARHDPIDAAGGPGVGCTVYAPVPKPRDPEVDRHEPKSDDSVAVASWRARMATDQAKVISRDRAATAECVNAPARGRGLVPLPVRGLAKVRAVASWHAATHNVMRMATLRAAVAVGA